MEKIFFSTCVGELVQSKEQITKENVTLMVTVLLSTWKEPVNKELSAQCSLPLQVETDEKQDQKANVNNSFCSKTKPAGPLGNKGGG